MFVFLGNEDAPIPQARRPPSFFGAVPLLVSPAPPPPLPTGGLLPHPRVRPRPGIPAGPTGTAPACRHARTALRACPVADPGFGAGTTAPGRAPPRRPQPRLPAPTTPPRKAVLGKPERGRHRIAFLQSALRTQEKSRVQAREPGSPDAPHASGAGNLIRGRGGGFAHGHRHRSAVYGVVEPRDPAELPPPLPAETRYDRGAPPHPPSPSPSPFPSAWLAPARGGR
ncbi:unnamed protein product [Diplocarpon coronariae]